MWLLPLLDRVSTFAAQVYYRLTIAGGTVPRSGPVLLVANHPNSLFDPALVAAAARRPVRFLAKAPLFSDPAVGWLVRGSGAIPIYRPSDDPALVSRNDEAFRAAQHELARGAAVGIFPEGISHDYPGLVPLKTGAARIALGAALLRGSEIPIVPIGLTFRGKERFRSPALAHVGEPVAWSDLALCEPVPDVVRELTRRIEAALRNLTLNLEHWEDAPLVEWAAAIYVAEYGGRSDPVERFRARAEAGEILARLRTSSETDWKPLAAEVQQHAHLLESFGIKPADLRRSTSTAAAASWTAQQALTLLLLGGVGVLGSILFYVPYRVTGAAVARLETTPDVRSSYYALGGALIFLIWIALLAGSAAALMGWRAGVASLVVLPVLALVSVAFRDRWHYARKVARRFLALRTRREMRHELATRQAAIARRLRELREQVRV